ncbi:MAG: sel1 repeat family protein, partial [Brevundimonas sp.]
MRDSEATTDERPDRRGRRSAAAVGVIALVAMLAGSVASCGNPSLPFAGGGETAASNACPRPQSVTGSEFNAQEAGLRQLRRAAFRGDFFAQLELGTRYAALRATDKNIEDPIESAVWTGLALANDEGFA